MEDPRFSHIATDPRFKAVPRRKRKVTVDSRFKSMFTDKRFQVKYKTDKRGSAMQESSSENLRKYYDISTADDEGNSLEEKVKERENETEDNVDEEELDNDNINEEQEDENDSEEIEKEESDEEEEEDESDIESDASSTDIDDDDLLNTLTKDGVFSQWLDETEAVPQSESTGYRLALCSMNWDRVNAVDLLAHGSSAMSSGGTSAAASPPEGNEASTDPTEGSFVPRDSSYNEFMRRLPLDRQKLLDVAVKFLINPRVVNSNDDDKIAFLNKKGLNEEEIYWVRQEAASRPSPSLAVPAPPTSLALATPTQATPTLTHLFIRGVLVGSMFGIFVYWIKGVVSKWFDSLKVQQERQEVLEERVQEIRTTLETTMQELQQATLSIKVLLERQQEQITQLSSTQSNVVTSNELRTINSELSTLKGLLLNRHQFPTPQKDSLSLPPGIPSWQRNASLPLNATSDSSKGQEESSGDGGGGGGGGSSTGTTVQRNSDNDNDEDDD